MSSLAQSITVSYGSYTFPVETETEAVRLTPVYDSAGRTVVHTEFYLRVRTVIQNTTSGTDPGVLAARRILETPGLALRVVGLGVGVIRVNAGGKSDVQWGPKPGGVSFKPLGGGNAVELTWEVTARMPDCADAATGGLAVMEFCYRLAFAIDDAGRTTRTYSGHVVIPQTRRAAGSYQIRNTADALREDVVPAPLPGFRRTSQNYDLSEDKCRLDFTVVDAQAGAIAPPAGVARVRVSHRRNSLSKTMGTWAETITATYTLAPNGRPDAATRAFFALVSDRAAATRAAAQAAFAAGGISPDGTKASVIPLEYSDGAEFGSDDLSVATFSVKLQVVSTQWSMLAASSLWRQVPQSNWTVWYASVPLGPRGHARLVFNPGEDAIQDLCRPADVTTVAGIPAFVGAPTTFQALSSGFTAEASYLSYKTGVHAEPVSNNVVLKTLPEKARDVELRTPPADASPGAVGSAVAEATTSLAGGKGRAAPGAARPDDGNFDAGSAKPIDYTDAFFAVGGAAKTKPPPAAKPSPKPDPNVPVKEADVRVQQRVTPVVYVTLFGQALRVGYPVPVPALVSIDGVKLVSCNVQDAGYGFWQQIVGSACGVPIYAATWKIKYVALESLKNGVPAIPVAV